MEEILTPEQVAQILQVHPFTVLKFIKQEKLKASKLGRVYRIRKSDVDAFLDEQANRTTTKKADSDKKAKKNIEASTLDKVEPKGNTTKEVQESVQPEQSTGEDQPSKQIKPIEPKQAGQNHNDRNQHDHYVIELNL